MPQSLVIQDSARKSIVGGSLGPLVEGNRMILYCVARGGELFLFITTICDFLFRVTWKHALRLHFCLFVVFTSVRCGCWKTSQHKSTSVCNGCQQDTICKSPAVRYRIAVMNMRRVEIEYCGSNVMGSSDLSLIFSWFQLQDRHPNTKHLNYGVYHQRYEIEVQTK